MKKEEAINKVLFSGEYDNLTCEQVREEIAKLVKEPLLTDGEKEYIKQVIKPFNDKVVGIAKIETMHSDTLWLDISYMDNDGDKNHIPLPIYFGYESLETGREYSLKELGLD